MGAHKHSTTAHRYLPSWSYKGQSSFADRVLKWADNNFSDFPWRQARSPYEILIAEVLLKRTTATAVARVYDDFILKFPSPQDLASTRDEELIKALSNVGLQHQRTRSIKHLTLWLLCRHGGVIPSDLAGLLEVPGLGDYSATAILSFGFGVPTAVLDANVERILLRVFGNTLPPRPSWTLLRKVAQTLLPSEGHQRYNYGLLDLGRLICRYSDPKCGECPLVSVCDFVKSRRERTHRLAEENAIALPGRLRAIRQDRGLSLKRLADAARVSKLTVIRIETGRTTPRRETLQKIARVLCVCPEELVG